MKISILTLFPEMFDGIFDHSIIARAKSKKLVDIELINIRDFGEGRHKIVDDRPYGGGAGMVLRADILAKTIKSLKVKKTDQTKIILTSSTGEPYKQKKARELSKLEELVIICGHYEGVDERFIKNYVDEQISIGDYVLTGGEIPAMVIVDSVARLIPGVLKKEEATINESFTENLLEGPQYTKPREFEELNVPKVLLSGNHAEIVKWRTQKSLEKTKKQRPDLLK